MSVGGDVNGSGTLFIQWFGKYQIYLFQPIFINMNYNKIYGNFYLFITSSEIL